MSGSRECAKDWSDSLIKVIDSINNIFLSAFLKQDYDHKFAVLRQFYGIFGLLFLLDTFRSRVKSTNKPSKGTKG